MPPNRLIMTLVAASSQQGGTGPCRSTTPHREPTLGASSFDMYMARNGRYTASHEVCYMHVHVHVHVSRRGTLENLHVREVQGKGMPVTCHMMKTFLSTCVCAVCARSKTRFGQPRLRLNQTSDTTPPV